MTKPPLPVLLTDEQDTPICQFLVKAHGAGHQPPEFWAAVPQATRRAGVNRDTAVLKLTVIFNYNLRTSSPNQQRRPSYRALHYSFANFDG